MTLPRRCSCPCPGRHRNLKIWAETKRDPKCPWALHLKRTPCLVVSRVHPWSTSIKAVLRTILVNLIPVLCKHYRHCPPGWSRRLHPTSYTSNLHLLPPCRSPPSRPSSFSWRRPAMPLQLDAVPPHLPSTPESQALLRLLPLQRHLRIPRLRARKTSKRTRPLPAATVLSLAARPVSPREWASTSSRTPSVGEFSPTTLQYLQPTDKKVLRLVGYPSRTRRHRSRSHAMGRWPHWRRGRPTFCCFPEPVDLACAKVRHGL